MSDTTTAVEHDNAGTGTEAPNLTSGTPITDAKTQQGNADTTQNTDTQDKDDAPKFTQRQLNAFLKKEREKAASEAEQARKDADLSESDKQKKRADSLEAELKTERRQRWADRAAVKHKLPDGMADRLRGETEEEIEEDAKALFKMLPQATPPDLDSQKRGGSQVIVEEKDAATLARGMGVRP